jgi:hypothetical protein
MIWTNVYCLGFYTGSFTRADSWRQRVKLQADESPFDELVLATNPEFLQSLQTLSNNVSSLKRTYVQMDNIIFLLFEPVPTQDPET